MEGCINISKNHSIFLHNHRELFQYIKFLWILKLKPFSKYVWWYIWWNPDILQIFQTMTAKFFSWCAIIRSKTSKWMKLCLTVIQLYGNYMVSTFVGLYYRKYYSNIDASKLIKYTIYILYRILNAVFFDLKLIISGDVWHCVIFVRAKFTYPLFNS